MNDVVLIEIGTMAQLARLGVFEVTAPPPFYMTDTPGGRFWSRRRVVEDGIRAFTAFFNQMPKKDRPDCEPVVAVLNTQAQYLFYCDCESRA
jgi:hypothetical protein